MKNPFSAMKNKYKIVIKGNESDLQAEVLCEKFDEANTVAHKFLVDAQVQDYTAELLSITLCKS